MAIIQGSLLQKKATLMSLFFILFAALFCQGNDLQHISITGFCCECSKPVQV